MNCIFDKEKIGKVLEDFYNSTGIAITLYDAAMRVVSTLPEHSRCCAYIRSDKMCLENCDRSNLIHMKGVCQDHAIRRYTCHAGMMETILPVIYEDVLIAYLQIGQFRDAEQIYSSSRKTSEIAEAYGLDREQLLSLYNELPLVSNDKLDAVFNILEILIKSFWRDGLIMCQRSMLSIKIEQYITDHLTEKLYVDELCKRFYLSKNALYKLFRDEFHTTVVDFITEKRIRYAKKLLKSEADVAVSQIASVCGFPDYNYFIRLFKVHTGKTPLQFKKSGANEE